MAWGEAESRRHRRATANGAAPRTHATMQARQLMRRPRGPAAWAILLPQRAFPQSGQWRLPAAPTARERLQRAPPPATLNPARGGCSFRLASPNRAVNQIKQAPALRIAAATMANGKFGKLGFWGTIPGSTMCNCPVRNFTTLYTSYSRFCAVAKVS